MAAQATRQWGVTPPISMTLPTPEELAANDDLIAELKAQNNFELPSETERRQQTLQLIQKVVILHQQHQLGPVPYIMIFKIKNQPPL